MKIFNLPDLGEGLPDAEIHQWHIKEGDEVKEDQVIVSMETAKAVVDVPAPQSGKIAKLYGKVGDIIKTGQPLVGFAAGANDAPAAAPSSAATVVGNIESTDVFLQESATGIQRTPTSSSAKALPAARILAKKHGIDLATITPTGPQHTITIQDVEYALQKSSITTSAISGAVPLRGVRRAMAQAMSESHASVVPVTLSDDADIQAWPKGTDITFRIIRAMTVACQAEPTLNAWYDSASMSCALQSQIHLGLAMDSKDGLFVPVLKDVANKTQEQLRELINQYKEQVQARQIPPENLRGATITLSNFGMFAGRYANPVIVPPMVAILGTGRLREVVVSVNGQFEVHRMLPLSLTFDHRAVTGGEATRFLAAVIRDLEKG